jgi:hypothetical protein
MRIVFNLGLIGLLACNPSTDVSDRHASSSIDTANLKGTGGRGTMPLSMTAANPWVGIVPDKAIVTTQRVIHNMVFIDSDASMYTELAYGLFQFAQSLAKLERKQSHKGFEIVSEDRAFIIVDNTMGFFKNSNRITVVDKILTNADIKSEVIRLLSDQIMENPDYAQTIIPNIVILTDGDIPESDQQELSTFLRENFPDDQVYVHLITSPETPPQYSAWCLPEARPTQLTSFRQQYPNSLQLSICDTDWFAHFRNIGKRVIYDQAIARVTLPNEAYNEGGTPFVRVNGMTLPANLIQHDESRRELTMRVVDMPPNIQTFEIGMKN